MKTEAAIRNTTLLGGYRALQMALFPVSVITLFQAQHLGLDMRQTLLLQAVASVTVAVFELPCGWLADRIGCRRSLQGAALVMMASWGVYLGADGFALAALAEILRGIGWSLVSGCDEALLYESLKVQGKQGDYTRWNGRHAFYGQCSEAGCAIVAGFLYSYNCRLPLILAVICWGANFFIAGRLQDAPRERQQMRGWDSGVRLISGHWRDPAVLWPTALFICLGLASYVNVWTIPIFAVENGLPAAAVGLLWATANLCVAFGSLISHRLESRHTVRLGLLACLLMVCFSYAGFANTATFWTFAFYFPLTLARGIKSPLLMHALQRRFPSSDRAALLSVNSLFFRSAAALLFVVTGWSLDWCGHQATWTLIGSFLVCCGLFIVIAGKKHLER